MIKAGIIGATGYHSPDPVAERNLFDIQVFSV